jgi:hypothetical protein
MNVTLTFEDEIKNPMATVQAVRNALVSWVDSSESGLGEGNDTFTRKIEVTNLKEDGTILTGSWRS